MIEERSRAPSTRHRSMSGLPKASSAVSSRYDARTIPPTHTCSSVCSVHREVRWQSHWQMPSHRRRRSRARRPGRGRPPRLRLSASRGKPNSLAPLHPSRLAWRLLLLLSLAGCIIKRIRTLSARMICPPPTPPPSQGPVATFLSREHRHRAGYSELRTHDEANTAERSRAGAATHAADRELHVQYSVGDASAHARAAVQE